MKLEKMTIHMKKEIYYEVEVSSETGYAMPRSLANTINFVDNVKQEVVRGTPEPNLENKDVSVGYEILDIDYEECEIEEQD